MTLDDELRTCIETIPGCFAAGLVDLDSGMMLALHGQEVQDAAAAEALAAAAVEVMLAPAARRMEAALEAPFSTAAVAGIDSLHVFQRLPERSDHVLMLGFGSDTEAAEAIAATQAAAAPVEAAGLW